MAEKAGQEQPPPPSLPSLFKADDLFEIEFPEDLDLRTPQKAVKP
jgi:hypothetical protein